MDGISKGIFYAVVRENLRCIPQLSQIDYVWIFLHFLLDVYNVTHQ